MAKISSKFGFIQSLISGQLRKEMLKPFPTYSKEDRKVWDAMLSSISEFAIDQIDAEEIDKSHTIPDTVKKYMGELGLWGLVIPEEYGGCGQSDIVYNKTMEILTGACGSTAVMWGAHLSIGLKAILLFGTDEQKKQFLPELSSGKKLAAFALTEPEAGSDAGSVKTTAVISDDGKHYVLNGAKQWITNGGLAHVFTVLAKVIEPGDESGKYKLTAFIVTRDMEGFSHGAEEDKLGICGSSTTPLYLENVKVPVENILGGVGAGFRIFMEVLDNGRLGLGAGCVGTVKTLLPHALKHALERVQFRKTISEFEMIKDKFAQVLIRTFTAESMVYYTTWMKGILKVPVSVEAAICKVFASEALWDTIYDCLQVAGGNGFMKDYPYERYLRDARINTIFEGTNEIQRMFIAASGLMQPSVCLHKYQKELSKDWAAREAQVDKIVEEIAPSPDDFAINGFADKLKTQIETVTTLAQRLNQVVNRTVLLHGREVRDMQFVQTRMADAVIDLFGMYANIARVENLIQSDHKTADQAFTVSELFARQAGRRISQNLDDMEKNQDEKLTLLADLMYSSKKYPFEILDY